MKKFLIILLSLFLFAMLIGGGLAGYTAWSLLGSPDDFKEEAVISIAAGQGTRSIANMLAEEGLIRNARSAELYARFTGLHTGLQAGRYILEPGTPAIEILQKIHSGDAVFEHIRVTIPEGWMINEIDAYLSQIGIWESGEFIEAALAHIPDPVRHPLTAGIPEGVSLEGYLHPNTYFILAETTPQQLIIRMLDELHRQLPEDVESQAAGQNMSVHEVLTLASIVQKESPRQDMPEIAGVFTNRLAIRMRLQSDATVNYVLGTRNLQPTFADTAVQHPYNTYRIPGLPPGPINNPGTDAILATLNPATHDYLFFLHKPNLESVFTRTFGEHLAAKARYLD